MPEPTAVDVFEQHRSRLLAVAYRMLGSVADAEDVVQETWLRWQRADHASVADPAGYLVRTVSRVAIDQLRLARTSRETYVGPWLPEPVLADEDVAGQVELGDTISIAMLVVLETLSPLERAVFVLREVFGYDYREIGEVLDRSAESVRQLAHRARSHVAARRPRFDPDPDLHRSVTERFMRAAVGGDLQELLEVLSPDVTLTADAGGRVRAPRVPIRTADKVGRFIAARADAIPEGTTIEYVDVNARPGAVAVLDGSPYAVFSVDVDPATGLVTHVRLIANPDKLSALVGQWSGRSER